MSDPTTCLLVRMQAEAETWSVEEPERALWLEAKAEIERLRASPHDNSAYYCGLFMQAKVEAERLRSIVRRFIALDGGKWHVERHAQDTAKLREDARAALGEPPK